MVGTKWGFFWVLGGSRAEGLGLKSRVYGRASAYTGCVDGATRLQRICEWRHFLRPANLMDIVQESIFFKPPKSCETSSTTAQIISC